MYLLIEGTGERKLANSKVGSKGIAGNFDISKSYERKIVVSKSHEMQPYPKETLTH